MPRYVGQQSGRGMPDPLDRLGNFAAREGHVTFPYQKVSLAAHKRQNAAAAACLLIVARAAAIE